MSSVTSGAWGLLGAHCGGQPVAELSELSEALVAVYEYAGVDYPGDARGVIDNCDRGAPGDLFNVSDVESPARFTDRQ